MMPVKEDKTSDGPPSAKEDSSTAQSPPPGERSLATVPSTSQQNEGPASQTRTVSGDFEVKTIDAEALQVPSHTPKPSPGPEVRERLKFILGASEDNSSDDEPGGDKPPSGAPRTLTSSQKSLEQASCAQAQSRTSTIK